MAWISVLAKDRITAEGLIGGLVRPMLNFGLRNMASTAPNSLNGRFDQLVLAFAVPAAALGQYAVAVSLSLLVGPLAAAFGHVAFPALARGTGDQRDTVRRSVRGALVLAAVGCADRGSSWRPS